MNITRQLIASLTTLTVMSAVSAQEIRVGYWESGASAAMGAVVEDGKFLQAEGLQPKWVKTTKLAELNRALISKSIDVILSGGTVPSLRLGAEHVPAKIVLGNLIADANFVVRENSPIKSLADLKGKKIGSTPPGSTMYALVRAILEDGYGMGDKDFQQIPSGEAQLLTFMQRGDIDAAVMRTITLKTLGAKANLRVLSTVPNEWKKLIKADSPPILGVTVFAEPYIKQHPDAVTKYVAAYIKATQWGAQHPDGVAGILERRLQMTQTDARAYAATWTRTYFAAMRQSDVASIVRMGKIFQASGNLPGTINKDLFDTGPYERAQALLAKQK